ncbi:hypothetical protein [Luteimonas sp. SDU82]|uniref:hypothetical protein n=1 Tax=Luteimonas sp. SDU82 TaxID=3422592 RepID=UPI003EB84817
MDVQGSSRPKRDRPIFVDILLIGAVMAALMYGGLRLLGSTHDAWAARYGSKPAPAPTRNAQATRPPPPTRTWTAADDAEYWRLKAEAEARRRQYESMQRNTRCIDGTLFHVEGSSYTSAGRC